MEVIKLKLRSISPLLMHRYGGAKPSADKVARGKKTQSHIDAEYKRDWLASAYWENATFHIPPELIEAALSEAAKEFRGGKTFKKAIAVEDFFIPLSIFKGPDDQIGFQASGELEDWYKAEFVDIRGVRIGPSRIDRCRPIFREWGLEFTVHYDIAQVSKDQLLSAAANISIGDFRPRYGRVRLVGSQEVKAAA